MRPIASRGTAGGIVRAVGRATVTEKVKIAAARAFGRRAAEAGRAGKAGSRVGCYS